MRDVPGGWFIRYTTAPRALPRSLSWCTCMFRGLIYGSYKGKRELIWLIGMAIYLALMVRSWAICCAQGQMSFWELGNHQPVQAHPYIGNERNVHLDSW
ncbi:MAG: hypothetical protein R3E93_08895 [Thiothrix sp.]